MIIIQEDLENKSVSLSIKTGKLTAELLAKAMRAAYKQIQKALDAPGKMSFKQLRKGGELSEIDITNENIKAFDPIARKYGIRYHLEKDASSTPPTCRPRNEAVAPSRVRVRDRDPVAGPSKPCVSI